jgi:LDH2 family malate/lactate/ureidoglycolate dehydrogenase
MAIYPKSETDRRISASDLLAVSAAIFARCGMDDGDAVLLAETLVHADRRGVHSHGVLRIPDYVKKLTSLGVDPNGRPRVVSRRAGAIVVDGGNSMGQIGGTFAMDQAIEAARETGIAFAALGESNHCGALDWYTMRAARHDMIGLAGTNALPTMAPWGGVDKIVGINPLSVALPGARTGIFVLDFAFGATAHGKIRVYNQKGSPLPEGWAFDAEGNPTTDAAAALTGLIQPIGGHKGVGLGMVIGMLSTLLSGAEYGTGSGNMIDGARAGVDGQFFIAIDIGAFLEPSAFRARVDHIVDQVHAAARRPDVDRLYVPGEIEADIAREYDRDGILLAGTTLDDIIAAAGELGVDTTPLTNSPEGTASSRSPRAAAKHGPSK